MSITKSISSHLMTGLLAWRNPQGREEVWMKVRWQGDHNICRFGGKVLTTEVGLSLLAATAVVETVVYSVFALLSLVLYPVTNKPCHFFAKLLQSSSFTIFWGLADIFVYNPFFVNVMTQESFARYFVQNFIPRSIRIFRDIDILHLSEWRRQHQEIVLNPMLTPAINAVDNVINEGAKFLINSVLSGIKTDQTIERFKSPDPLMIEYILTRAIYLFTVGQYAKKTIPEALNAIPNAKIEELRKLGGNATVDKYMSTPDEFGRLDLPTLDAQAKEIFSQISAVYHTHLSRSLLAKGCWQKAVELLK